MSELIRCPDCDAELRGLHKDGCDWERNEARAAARELFACWVPPEHQNSYLEHWGWLKAAAPTAPPGGQDE